MTLFSHFWRRPRTTFLRRAAFQIHLWAGLGVGLYLAVMGVTGAALVFEEEIEEQLRPELYHVRPAAAPPASVADLLRVARQAYPDRQVTALYAPTEKRGTVEVYLRKGDEVLYAFLHPVTAEILGDTLPSTSVVRWLQDLHFNLCSGRTGRTVNGVGGLLLFLLCMTGIVIWWPGVGRCFNALRVRFAGSWKRANWELHSAAGFWTAAVLAMWAVTGFYFGFSVQVASFVNRLSPLSQVEPPQSRPRPDASRIDLEKLLDEAAVRSPGSHFFGLTLPANAKAPYVVFMARRQPAEKQHCDYVYFDRYSGDYIRTWRRGMSFSAGDKLMSLIVPLHFGTFGGIPVKILWTLLGLTPPLLFATGIVMWWNRVLRRRVAREGLWRAQEQSAAGGCSLANAPQER
jgi:uncharacterized iron-regulated membrane protein